MKEKYSQDNIVVIGGGTGSYTVLRGLKNYTKNLTAIVNMFDSGGSTGRLRDEFGYLPAGDVRRCLLALASDEESTKILRELMNYRFDKGQGLEGHSFGNLLLTALKEITKDELSAIEYASKILRVNGKVLPVTLDNCVLCAELIDGTIIKGETNIDVPKYDTSLKIKKVYLEPEAKLLKKAEQEIKKADALIIGPGDLYTSILPNFVVKGMKEAFNKSQAKKIYVCNLMTKNGETNKYTAGDHAKKIIEYAGMIDCVVCNNAKIKQELIDKYAVEKAEPVVVDKEEIQKLKIQIIEEELITEPELIRHDSQKLAKVIMKNL